MSGLYLCSKNAAEWIQKNLTIKSCKLREKSRNIDSIGKSVDTSHPDLLLTDKNQKEVEIVGQYNHLVCSLLFKKLKKLLGKDFLMGKKTYLRIVESINLCKELTSQEKERFGVPETAKFSVIYPKEDLSVLDASKPYCFTLIGEDLNNISTCKFPKLAIPK